MMKNRIFLLLMGLVVAISSFALSKDSLKAITMVSYEQGWLDSNGTLALKNNTKQTINNVAFRMIYLSMKGEPLDYKDFSVYVHIPSGLTKKVDVEAYEYDRHYSYYTSEAYYPPHRFKVKFQLQGYNQPMKKIAKSDGKEVDKSSNRNNMPEDEMDDSITNADPIVNLVSIAVIVILLSISIALFVLVAQMARARHRSVTLWLLVSFIFSPFLAIIILSIVGNHQENIPYV